ncbi:MAG TPA: Ig domain-containing protein [Vicinamibacterales bacterium]|nr:Ig domain-containing protein [Vicinamibacterales bacterium]
MRALRFAIATAAGLAAALGHAPRDVRAQNSGAPSAYDAVTDRGPRAKPTLVKVGGAGFSFNDPVFGTRMWRVTDRSTRPGFPDRSFRTPSGTHQNAWGADDRHFYVTTNDGTIIPFAFDPSTGSASRIDPSRDGEGGLTLKFYLEPQFSFVDPNIVYGTSNTSGSNLHTVDAFDFNTGRYSTLLDLETVVPASTLKDTYVGVIGSSSGPVEKLLAMFGGASQDRHHYVVVFDRANPKNRRLLDTSASTLDGKRTPAALDFTLHHAFIDRSGRFVLLYPSGADRQGARQAPPLVVWDLSDDSLTSLPLDAAHAGGHDAYSFGFAVNQDCCTATTYDAAQWQLRALSTPMSTRDLVQPVIAPKEVQLADHPSWNNAQPDRLVPFISGLYRYGVNDAEWRPFDDEIIAVQTDVAPDRGADIWRFAHHRSDVRNDNDASQFSFWYTPRPNVSPDGRWVLFTSNWEKTLGTDPVGSPGERARQDVFLLQLRGSDDTSAGPLAILTTRLPDAKRNTAYVAYLTASGLHGAAVWKITRGALPAGLKLDAASGVISGTPTSAGTFFTVTVSDGASSDSRTFALAVPR